MELSSTINGPFSIAMLSQRVMEKTTISHGGALLFGQLQGFLGERPDMP